MSDAECDRLWSALDKANQYMEGLEERVIKLEGARPTRKAGDYFPDPAQLDPGGKLTTIALILREMLPPSGIPSPAQRLLLRIKAVVGGGAEAGAELESAGSSRSESAPAGARRRDG